MRKWDQQGEILHEHQKVMGKTQPPRDLVDAWAVGVVGLMALFGLVYGLAAYLSR
ncbi:hypothetical protein [Arthrobacter sp. QXT-31]|uniref:hypothetical protein n=1 Tax=Arthrobacter sp. QXT-31 TaxID=1357915 RepID=UPI0012F98657|nr:hypothetical protein [Arthrobacter sp. QXT-31]